MTFASRCTRRRAWLSRLLGGEVGGVNVILGDIVPDVVQIAVGIFA